MTTTTSPHLTPTTARPAEPPLRIAVIAASVRNQRLGGVLARWAADRAGAATGVEVDLIDLATCELPDDALLQPGGGGPRSVIADRLKAADAYVVVTPEYNHSYPASLKRAIDWHYGEWMFKAATVVSYGAQGGLLATEHLRGVFAELHVVTTRRVVAVREPWNAVDDEGFTAPPGTEKALDGALDELTWWGQTLRTARRDHPFQR